MSKPTNAMKPAAGRPDGSPRPARVTQTPFGTMPDGQPVQATTLVNAGIEVRFIALGGIITSILVPDRQGVRADVTLGYDSLAAYVENPPFFGALIGRYANRIARGRFSLDGREHHLPKNDGTNTLHGGPHGFHAVLWRVRPFERAGVAGAVLAYTSPAGEAGFPGELQVEVTYTLTDAHELVVDYHATTTEATPVNLTQHAYFNLAGAGNPSILGHELQLAAEAFTPADARLIPTGEIRPVAGTPFDFRTPTSVGARIEHDDEQLRLGSGYDHNFVLPARTSPEPAFAARAREPGSGRTLEVLTTEPGIQLYSGNHLAAGGPVGKHGQPYARRSGLALETQHFPDSPNQPAFPSTILRPGEEFTSRTIFRFGVD